MFHPRQPQQMGLRLNDHALECHDHHCSTLCFYVSLSATRNICHPPRAVDGVDFTAHVSSPSTPTNGLAPERPRPRMSRSSLLNTLFLRLPLRDTEHLPPPSCR